MGIEDILSLPETFEVDGKQYQSQFDCKTYAILEAKTGKAVTKIQDLIADRNLTLLDSIDVICISILKNHTEKEADELRQILMDKTGLISVVNGAVVRAFFKGIAPPEIFTKVLELQNKLNKLTEKEKKKTMKKA